RADSKLMSPAARERVFARALEFSQAGVIRFAVSFADARTIDARGIVQAVQGALNACLVDLSLPAERTRVFLDGLLRAPAAYVQKTVIGGDALVPVISLASVIAKVSRDAAMVDLAREYPRYGLELHKGYGTKAHIAALRAFGPSPVHRRSFLSRILAPG
ncbi:MAG: ribonuclease HII, partial [Patescibacteria group bacterium]